MAKLAFTAILAALILRPPIAAYAVDAFDANGNRTVYGNGADTCAEVLVHTSTGDRKTREYWRMNYLQWLTGYMSGYVDTTPGMFDLELSNDAILDAFLSTCSTMPRELFVNIARENLKWFIPTK